MSTNYPFNDRQYIGQTSFNGQGAYYCEQKVRERLNEKSELSEWIGSSFIDQCGTFYRWGRDGNRRCDGWEPSRPLPRSAECKRRGCLRLRFHPFIQMRSPCSFLTRMFTCVSVYARLVHTVVYLFSFKKRNGENLRPQAANLVASHLNTPLKSSCKLFDYETL